MSSWQYRTTIKLALFTILNGADGRQFIQEDFIYGLREFLLVGHLYYNFCDLNTLTLRFVRLTSVVIWMVKLVISVGTVIFSVPCTVSVQEFVIIDEQDPEADDVVAWDVVVEGA